MLKCRVIGTRGTNLYQSLKYQYPGASFELKFRGGRAERPKASRPCQRRGAGGVWGRGVPLPSGDGVWGGGITIYEVSVWK